MLKLKKLILKAPQTEQGFTLFEVLVGGLIATAFVAVSMQALVLATMFRVRAQEKALASQMIQEDVEGVKFRASTYDPNTGDTIDFTVTSACSATNYSDGYAKEVFDNLPATLNPRQLGNVGKEFALERVEVTTGSTAPHKILRIEYIVSEWKDGSYVYSTLADRRANAIARDYIEVIPNVALRCP